MAINLYDVHAREGREAAHAEYMAHPGIDALIAEAGKRGYRKATIQEIHASIERSAGWAPDLHAWRGGLWVKEAVEEAA